MISKKISALLLLVGLAFSGAFAQTVTVTLPDTAVDAGANINIPIRVSPLGSSDGVLSGEWTFTTSSDLVEFQSIDTVGTILGGTSTQFNPTTGTFAFAATSPIEGSGLLVNLVVETKADAKKFDDTTIGVVDGRFNESDLFDTGIEGTVSIRGISISPKQPYLPLVDGETYQFNLSGTITEPVTWSSSNNSVATVSSDGLVEGVDPGSVRIYAEDAAGLKDSTSVFRVEPATLNDLSVDVSDKSVYQTLVDTVQVLVSDITGLNITSGQLDLNFSSDKIEILGLETDGTILQNYPTPTTFQNGNVISVAFADTQPLEGSGALLEIRFKVFREASGNATITPQNVLFNESLEAAVGQGTIQVVDAPVPVVSPNLLDITEGESSTFSVTSGGRAPYTWSIDDETVATINSSTGELQAVNRGTAIVTATDADGFTSEQIQVSVNDITVSMPDVEIVDNDTVTVPIETMDLSGLGIMAYEIEVEFDPNVATYEGAEIAGTLSEGLSVADSEPEPGLIKIAMATTSSMEGAGDLVQLQFSAAGSAGSGDITPLTLKKMQFNEPGPSSPTATKKSGSITIKKTAVPVKTQLSSPSDNATGIALDTDLLWNSTTDADTYELVLSQNSNLSSPVINETGLNGTSFNPSINFEYETTYYWRVRGVAGGGNGAWSDTWSFTTEPQPPLDTPVLTSPNDGASDLSKTVSFLWNSVSEATGYTLKVSTDSNFGSLVEDSNTSGTSLEVELENATTYYWKVVASDDSRSSESDSRSFTTQIGIAGTPELLSPDDDATGTDTDVTLRWLDTQYAESYSVELSTSSNFSSNVTTKEVSDTQATFSNLDLETTYYWRVSTSNSRGDGGTSNTFSFTTRAQGELATPDLIMPNNDAGDLSTSTTFSWSSVPEATEYRLLIDTDDGFTSPDINKTLGGTETEVSGLSFSTTYFWKVTATDGSRNSKSSVRSFTTHDGLPDAPELVSPSDGATGIETTVTLEWSAADLAESYRIQLSTNESFSSLAATDTFTGTSAEFDNLDYSITYYWRVTSINDQGESSSDIFSFTTVSGLPGAPLLSTPGDGAVDLEPPVAFSWEQTPGKGPSTDSYQIQVATENSFDNLVVDEVIEDFSIALENFSSETDLFWRVRAQNSEGFGPWSDVRDFTVKYFEAPTEVTAEVTRTFGNAANPQDYRLVALPGQVNESLASLLDGSAGVDWQAFWDNGSDQNFLVKYDGSQTFTVETGNGFWVTSQGSFEYNQTLDAVVLDADRQAVISLHEGWNIISNPLDIDVSWSSVESANGGSLQPVWGFEGSFEESSNFVSAKTGQAFYFLNDQGLDELVIPYEESSLKVKGNAENELRLTTHVEGNETSSSRIVFVDQKGKGQVDVVAPPGAFEEASIRFRSKKTATKRSNSLARIHHVLDPQGQSFEVVVTGTPGELVTIRLNGWDRSLSANAVLIDQNTGQSYDLSSSAGINLKPEKEHTRFSFVMGGEEYLKKEQSQFLPDQVELMPNYPNPFNPATTIRFALPQESKVQLQVFDVIGRKVATLINNEARSAGIHRIRFDASRQASGMYFAVIQIGRQRFVQKMLLIK